MNSLAAATDPRAEAIDLTDPALYADGIPHEVFRELREQRSVHWHGPVALPSNMDPQGARSDGFWAVLGHPEITEVNRDWERFRAADGPTLVAFPPQMRGTALIWMGSAGPHAAAQAGQRRLHPADAAPAR